MAERVEIFEVGPRDGLQNEKRQIPTVEKIALIDSTPEMAEANLEYIRALMSSPRRWEQLRGTTTGR